VRIIIRWILWKCDVVGLDWIGLAQDRQVVGTCECVNEPLGSIKYGDFLD
jgi:hypothetical protein